MHAGVKLGVSLAAAIVGTALSFGTAAGAAPRPRDEEGRGPGGVEVGSEGAARAMNRLMHRDEGRTQLCRGVVLPSDGLNIRSGPGIGSSTVGHLAHNAQVTTDWDTIRRRSGYLWVRLQNNSGWIADYKVGNGNGRWYVRYSNC